MCIEETFNCKISSLLIGYSSSEMADWPQMDSASQNILKLILKSPRFVLLRPNLTQFGGNLDLPVLVDKLGYFYMWEADPSENWQFCRKK